MKEALFLFLPCCFVSEVRTSFLWGCSHLVLGNHCLDIGTKRCCVHTLSTLYCATVYIVTPCQTLYWNMSLAARTKEWIARNLQKLCAKRDPVPTFVFILVPSDYRTWADSARATSVNAAFEFYFWQQFFFRIVWVASVHQAFFFFIWMILSSNVASEGFVRKILNMASPLTKVKCVYWKVSICLKCFFTSWTTFSLNLVLVYNRV